ncbi:uncharacterized protein EV154DRAFT_485088 [Mucor mucedo]|uniref:uncharacterized protein n=1 Tax=Mucor mucedo TaxID=29922 RepID=UPI00222092EF|nr:uncharacterized protein EV154DRAFT_485088 [Mucor mucedo]KAI7886543.1 hypothetical protein EV154DRAFT_485088 [Mucor mucedo]
MGNYTTSPAEAAHSALKGHNTAIFKCTMPKIFVHLDKISCDPSLIGNPIYARILKVISAYAIKKIREQVNLFYDEMKKNELRPCTGVFKTTMKLQWRPTIFDEEYKNIKEGGNGNVSNIHARSDIVVLLSSIDRRWHISKGNAEKQIAPTAATESTDMYADATETEITIFKLKTALDSIKFKHFKDEKLDLIHIEIIQPPPKKTKDSNLPSSQKLAKSGRILSQGEAVDVDVHKEARIKKQQQKKTLPKPVLTSHMLEKSARLQSKEVTKPHHHVLQACMPKFMIGHVALVTDVDGDGNCGFRTIATSVGKEDILKTAISVGVEVNDEYERDEDFYMYVRKSLYNHLISNKTHYFSYILADCIMEYEELLKRIHLSYRGGCEINNWMIMNSTTNSSKHMSGYLIADLYPRPVYFYSQKSKSICTFLPDCPINSNRTISFLFYGNHYISLQMYPDGPLPPLTNNLEYRKAIDSNYWNLYVNSRVALYKTLHSQETRNSTLIESNNPEKEPTTAKTAPLKITARLVSDTILCKPKRVVLPPLPPQSPFILKTFEKIRNLATPAITTLSCFKCQKHIFQDGDQDTSMLKEYTEIDILTKELDKKKKKNAENNCYERKYKKLKGEWHKLNNKLNPRLDEFCNSHKIQQFLPTITRYNCLSVDFESLKHPAFELVNSGTVQKLVSGEIKSIFKSKAGQDNSGTQAKLKHFVHFEQNKKPDHRFEVIGHAALCRFNQDEYKNSEVKKSTSFRHHKFLTIIVNPEIACRIIAEDQGVSLEDPAKIMIETYEIRSLLKPFDFTADFEED